VQRNRQFDNTQIRGQMSAHVRDRTDYLLADFLAQLRKLAWRQAFQIFRTVDSFQDRHMRALLWFLRIQLRQG
jgi:hypothetical protein